MTLTPKEKRSKIAKIGIGHTHWKGKHIGVPLQHDRKQDAIFSDAALL
jgi:hypothetical protein